MSTKNILELVSLNEQDVRVSVEKEAVSIYNTAADATAWCVIISLEDWEGVKKFINDQLLSK